MPTCTKRASSPMDSARQRRKAMTSWWTSRSISRIRATSTRAFRRMRAGASTGTLPMPAKASVASISISSHLSKRFSSDQIRAISGRV